MYNAYMYRQKEDRFTGKFKTVRIKGIYYPISKQANINPYGLFVSDNGNKYYDVHAASIKRI